MLTTSAPVFNLQRTACKSHACTTASYISYSRVPDHTPLLLACLLQGQQFRGYAFRHELFLAREGRFLVAFECAMDALRFCHSAQMLLMYTQWPPEAADFCGAAVSELWRVVVAVLWLLVFWYSGCVMQQAFVGMW